MQRRVSHLGSILFLDRTIAAQVLECRSGAQQPREHGSAADALECGLYGHLMVHYANGRSRPVRGAFLPERRPFTGLTHIIPASAGQSLEGNPRWSEITDQRSAALGKGQMGGGGRNVSTRGSMRSSAQLTTLSTEGESRPHTRGTEMSTTFADEVSGPCLSSPATLSCCCFFRFLTWDTSLAEAGIHERHHDRIRRRKSSEFARAVPKPKDSIIAYSTRPWDSPVREPLGAVLMPLSLSYLATCAQCVAQNRLSRKV
jgi:hypothetical protein